MKRNWKAYAPLLCRGLLCLLWILLGVIYDLLKLCIPLPIPAKGIKLNKRPNRVEVWLLLGLDDHLWRRGMSVACAVAVLNWINVGLVKSARPTPPLFTGDCCLLGF